MSFEIGESLEAPQHFFADDIYGLKQCCLCGKIINDIEMENHLVINHRFQKKEKSSKMESAKNDKIKEINKTEKKFNVLPERINKDRIMEHKCSCGKIFKHECHLRRHEERHKKIKNVFCENCSMGFLDINPFKKHIRVHTGERPYTCNDCDKKFKELTHLTTHKRVHTGEMPLECPKCDKKFKYYATKSNHRCSPALPFN